MSTQANTTTVNQARLRDRKTNSFINFNKLYASTTIACIAAKKAMEKDPELDLEVVPFELTEMPAIDPKATVGKMEAYRIAKAKREEKLLEELQAKIAKRHSAQHDATTVTPPAE